jgi:hypothetical protein
VPAGLVGMFLIASPDIIEDHRLPFHYCIRRQHEMVALAFDGV